MALTYQAHVNRFGKIMVAKLKENEHKAGWSQMTPDYLMQRMAGEVYELTRELMRRPRNPEQIAREAADVANFAMMVAEAVQPDVP